MNKFEYLRTTPSDINEHLETLRDLSRKCSHITEMGVRKCVSTWAFIEGLSKGKLVSIDIKSPEEYGESIVPVETACKEKGIEFTFIKGDTLDIEIEETDLLFIDTLHTLEQLTKELALHADKARKYIVFHDTTSCPEMFPAIDQLVLKGQWKIKDIKRNNNGLTILERC